MQEDTVQDPKVVTSAEGVRVLCLAEARGSLRHLNELAVSHAADIILHTGSFGFYDGDSTSEMDIANLTAAATFSSVVKPQNFKALGRAELREAVGSQLSELPLFLAGAESFTVPVYTIWGSSEDARVVEKFLDGSYTVPNLHLVDVKTAPLIPGTSIRLIGLPGAFMIPSMFDCGDGVDAVAGIAGSTWNTIWQIGELFHTVRETFNSKEIRLFVTHSALSEHPLLHYIALLVRADFTLSGSLHYRYPCSFSNSATDTELHSFERRFDSARLNFARVWRQVEPSILEKTANNAKLRELILSTVQLLTSSPRDAALPNLKQSYRNLWHFNLCDMDNGVLVLKASANGVVGATAESSGFDFNLRSTKKVPSDLTTDRDGSQGGDSSGVGEDDTTRSDSRDPDQKKRKQKEKVRKERDDKKEPRKHTEHETEPARPGLWFKDGNRPATEILGFLDEADRSAARVEFKLNVRADGTKTRFALVYFESQEQASQAYERVDKDAAGTVSILQPHQRHSARKFKGRGKW